VKKLTCIVCPKGCLLKVEKLDNEWIVEGASCKKGKEFAISEMTLAKRSLSSTVKTTFKNMPRLPVKTDGEIPRELISPLMEKINGVILDYPVNAGEIILKNVLDTRINIVATTDLGKIFQEKTYA
jgi:CxxC motif-containing protein